MKYGSGLTRPRWRGGGAPGTHFVRAFTLARSSPPSKYLDGRVEAGEYHEASDGRDLEQINIKHRTLLSLHPYHHHQIQSTDRRHTGARWRFPRSRETRERNHRLT